MDGKQSLTPEQQAVVEHFEGPLLVLAGPGSGKTRVMTHRIARLVERGIPPHQILAITFTNKAAGEMATRTQRLLPGAAVVTSTFHRFCARLLRRYAETVGLSASYSILDTGEQTRLMRLVLSDLDIDAVHYPPARILQRISRLKNSLVTAERHAEQYSDHAGSHIDSIVARVYPAWQQRLAASNSVDFDDLLLHVATMLGENEELRAQLDRRYRFILVDEYQDTNLAQYEIVRRLASDEPNLCVTGDPDQSIYGWRGAQIENILRFETDYPSTTVIRLEQNFRSTGAILRSADLLIAHNRRRKAKTLKTDAEDGMAVELLTTSDGRQEAETIATEISRGVAAGEFRWSDVAIFYRVNSLSRELERVLARRRVPCQIAAGAAFFDRTEIKDLLAYLRLLANPSDVAAFERIVNVPARAIGKMTRLRLRRWAESNGMAIMDAARQAGACPTLKRRAVFALTKFVELYDGLRPLAAGPVAELLTQVVRRSRYTAGWLASDQEDDLQREANVQELLNAAAEYDEAAGSRFDSETGETQDEDPTAGSLEGFLESTSLVNEADSVDPNAGSVTLMTLHAAKGLEFPVVYLIGVEQNLLPHERSLRQAGTSSDEIEEERRLLFVGMTRAMKRLTLTQTRERMIRGRPLHTIRSEFLAETEFVERDLSDRASYEDQLAFGDVAFSRPGNQAEPVDTDAHPPGFDEDSQWHVRRGDKGDTPAESATGHSREAVRLPAEEDARRGNSLLNDPRIRTGADLLAAQSKTEGASEAGGFAVGMAVRHPRYGLGTVCDVGGSPHRQTVTVEFRDDGSRQTFVAAKCPLQPVGLG